MTMQKNRKQRQDDADDRQLAYDSLSTAQKIAKLDAGKFTAKKQRAKLGAV